MTREVNILLLGETGAGKSTTLNAIANYLLFNTFTEARDNLSHFHQVVPSNFTLPDEDGGDFIVQSGDDANERCGGGQSATVAPTCYFFPFGNCVLRIIDTPGIGDTAGKETDVNNFDLIMGTLAPYGQLHGVVIVVNGQSKRKTTFFQYCIKNLVEQLHSSIKQNIVFCFTNSEISPGRFGAGPGYEALEGLLKKDISKVGLHLKRTGEKNCFFVENQGYRLLVAIARGYKANDLDLMTSAKSWNYSVKEVQAMFSRILMMPPHELKQTISINSAKRIIRDMFQPIIVLSQNLDEKIKQVQVYQQVIESLASKSEDFKENAEQLMEQYRSMSMYDVEMRARELPVLVCTALKCIESVVFNGEEKWHFKTRCCEPCYNIALWTGTVGELGIGWCTVMDGSFWSPTCSKCGCPASVHRRDAYDYVKVERPMAKQAEYDELLGKLGEARSEKDQKKVLLNQLNQTIEEMKAEKALVEKISAQFDYFINQQSLMSRNSKFIERIDKLIVAMTKDPHKGYQYTLSDLRSIKEAHKGRLAKLEKSIQSGEESPICVEDIQRLQEKLLTMKHSGPFFRNILEENQKLVEQAKKSEKIVAKGIKFASNLAQMFSFDY